MTTYITVKSDGGFWVRLGVDRMFTTTTKLFPIAASGGDLLLLAGTTDGLLLAGTNDRLLLAGTT